MKLLKILFVALVTFWICRTLTACKTSKNVTKSSYDSTVKENKTVEKNLDSVSVKTWDRETVIEFFDQPSRYFFGTYNPDSNIKTKGVEGYGRPLHFLTDMRDSIYRSDRSEAGMLDGQIIYENGKFIPFKIQPGTVGVGTEPVAIRDHIKKITIRERGKDSTKLTKIVKSEKSKTETVSKKEVDKVVKKTSYWWLWLLLIAAVVIFILTRKIKI